MQSIYPYQRINPAMTRYFNHHDILSLYHQFIQSKHIISKVITKEFLQAAILLVLALVLSCFFVFVFLPQVDQLMRSLGNTQSVLKWMGWIVSFILAVTIALFLILVCLALFLCSMEYRIMAYILWHEKRLFWVIKLYVTRNFAIMFKTFLDHGIKTQAMIDAIRNSAIDRFSRFFAYHIDDDLQKGSSLGRSLAISYLDRRFVLITQKGLSGSSLKQDVNGYIDSSIHELDYCLRRWSRWFKMFVYAYLIVLIAFYYRVLYLPMAILEVL